MATTAVIFVSVTVSEARSDKSGYTLWNPTPDGLLRDMTTDRPDITESAFTVDAGHFQIESDLFGRAVSRRDREGIQTRSFHVATTNFRIGLTNWSELSFVVRPYKAIDTIAHDGTTASRHTGVGGIDLRVKFNLWGNDSFENPGDTAFALLPFVTVPTDKGNGVSPSDFEGGIAAMFAIQITDKYSLGVNGVLNTVRNEGGAGVHNEWLSSASLAYAWTEHFSTYYEVVARINTRDERGAPIQLAGGITYKLRKNLQLDAGVLIGITSAADKFSPFIGISTRF